jgi:hypothetical protein
MESGTITSGDFNTLMADAGRAADLDTLVNLATTRDRIERSLNCLNLIVGSANALSKLFATARTAAKIGASGYFMSVFASNASAMTYVAASDAAMAAVAESNDSLIAVFGTSTARQKVYDASNAVNVLAASVNAKTYMLSIDQTSNNSTASHVSVNTGRTILTTQKINNATYTSFAGANADTYSTQSVTAVDRFVKVTNLTHRSNSSGQASTVTYISME